MTRAILGLIFGTGGVALLWHSFGHARHWRQRRYERQWMHSHDRGTP